MQNGPINTQQSARLERDYVTPIVQMLLENIKELELPSDQTELILGNLLGIITEEKISAKSTALPFHQDDHDLKAHIASTLASHVDKEKAENALDNFYHLLHMLVHEYYLNKTPDSDEDIQKNTETADKFSQDQITGEQLYEQSLNVFNKLSIRLLAYGPEIADEDLKSAVISATKNAITIALQPSKIEIIQTSPPTFTPAYRDPILLKRAQISQDAALAEDLAKQLQEEDDRAFALRLQNEPSQEEERGQSFEDSNVDSEGSDEDNTVYYDQENSAEEDDSGDDRVQHRSQDGSSDEDSAQYYDQADTPENSEASEESSNDSYSPVRRRRSL
ncbi:hypothetical protein [Candidatus Berkiella aquae]|uniref:Uncharacterized protein n=1 Tax=Candidatus Berkiella aquae TaxID=295108 RepID=A0A0Q9YB38_9GAMM|nr:hypothetical protein [Candidatus Berkiella aquae]MCS5710631.1 hypothetical protein [Candidatus Berkiella aquae]